MIEFGVLGPLVVRRDGAPVAIRSSAQRRLLAALLCHAGRPVTAEELSEVLWDDAPPPGYRSTTQVYIHRLRRTLGAPERVAHGPGGYELQVDSTEVDAYRFAELARDGRECRQRGRPELARVRFSEALALWRGPAYADVAAARLIADQAAQLERQRQRVWQERIEVDLDLGRHVEVLPELSELVEANPYQERLRALLMLAFYRAGRQAEALALFRDTRTLLGEQLGVEPGPALRRLHEAMLRGDQRLTDLATASLDGDWAAVRPAVGQPGAVARPSPAPPPRQLPAAVASFTGRGDALKALDELLPRPEPDPAAPVPIAVVVGTAGVGKTALAVHWAHRVAERFPDGQLYVDLRGYGGGPPQRPVEALAAMLRALGTPPEEIPVDEAQAAALHRSRLAGRRVLLVLDNAGSAEQVRPLLPGYPGCLALVTSRDRLAGLVAREGARSISLDVLTPAEAVTLLTRFLGPDRVGAEPEAAAELSRACAHLPLALRIAAANLAVHPHRTLAGYAAELAAGDRLTALVADGDERTAVRAALALSYRSVPTDARRMFRLLGLVPGRDVTVATAAVLAGVPPPAARRLLDRLAGAHLVQESAPGRYAFHDLLRLYARQLADAEDPPAERDAAWQRLLDWYLHTATAAADLLYPQLLRLPPGPARPAPGPVPFAQRSEALAWLDAEVHNLAAAIRQAAEHGPYPQAWRLADSLRGYFIRRRHTVLWRACAADALRAGERAGDLPAQAAATISRADSHLLAGEYAEATPSYTGAAELARRGGWVDGEAMALSNLGMVCREQGRLARAADLFRRSLVLCERVGRLGGQATNRSKLAVVDQERGLLREALAHHTQALSLYRRLGSLDGEALTLANLGLTYQDLGELATAHHHLRQASALAQKVGDRVLEANVIEATARVHRDAGELAQARRLAEQAQAMLADGSDPRYDASVLTLLGSLDVRAGRVRDGVDTCRRALRLARERRNRLFEVEALLELAAGHVRLADFAAADRYGGEALECARASSLGVAEGRALTVLAEIRLGEGRWQEGERYARQALDNHRGSGHRLGEAQALAVLARLRRAVGDPVAARRHRDEAVRLLREIGAPVPAALAADD